MFENSRESKELNRVDHFPSSARSFDCLRLFDVVRACGPRNIDWNTCGAIPEEDIWQLGTWRLKPFIFRGVDDSRGSSRAVAPSMPTKTLLESFQKSFLPSPSNN